MFRSFVRSLRTRSAHRPTRGRSQRSTRLLVQALEARAVPSLDQVFDPVAAGGWNVSTHVAADIPGSEAAQTFTVGITGVLTRVDLYIFKFSGTVGDLVLDIRGTEADGKPTTGAGQELLTTTIPAASVPGGTPAFFTFDLSSFNLFVSSGQKLAATIAVAPDVGADTSYWIGGRIGDPYPNGGNFVRVVGQGGWTDNGVPNADMGFRTFVDAGAAPPVVTLPSGPVNFTEGNPPVVLDAAASVTDPDSGIFDTGSLTVSLTANATADDRLSVRNEGTAFGQIGVSGVAVTFGGTIIGSWSGGVGSTPLVVSLNGSANLEAVQALVRNVTFANLSDTPSTAARTVQLVLDDGLGGISAPAAKTVTVTAANDSPTVTTNVGLTLDEGAGAAIGSAILAATDPDNSQAQLTFTVTLSPAHGTVRLSGNPVSTFTQADINAGLVSYQHDGSEGAADAFTFTVSDGTATTSATPFNITVVPQNDPPVVATNAGLTVMQSGSVTIASTRLGVIDPDNNPAQLAYSVTTAPTHGTLRLSGNPTSTFTQADINTGLVSYQHDGSGTVPDSFAFVASDGSLSTAPTTVSITVLSSNSSIVTVSGFDPVDGTVTFTGDGGGDPNDHLELFAVDIGGGQFVLGHNLTDPNLESNTDLDPTTPGVQQLILGSGDHPLITVDLKTGDDSLGIDNAGGHFTTPVSYDGGVGRDLLRLNGTLANTWILTGANSGTVIGTAVGFVGTEDLTGSEGDDLFVFKPTTTIGRLDGRGGVNTLDYRSLNTPVEVLLPVGSASHTDAVAGIQNVVGGSEADLLVGGAEDNAISGEGGDDSILGGAGNDVLTGGAGNDLLAGGAGIDRLIEMMPFELKITLTNTSLNGGVDTGLDVLSGIETASLTGGAANNVIRASTFSLGSVTLAGGAGNDKLFGGTQGDLLIGGDGKDLLVGGAGSDTFTGGLGNDTFNGGAGDDMVRETGISGGNVTLTSTVLKSAANVLGTDMLISIGRAFLSLADFETTGRKLRAAGFLGGPVTLIGGSGADTLIGTARSGDLLMGGDGADVLNSGKGADTVDGGLGVDTLVTFGGAALGDVVSNIP